MPGMLCYGAQGLRAVAALGHHFHLRELLEAHSEAAAGELLIVDDDGAKRIHAASWVA